jgi:hypothetical protein
MENLNSERGLITTDRATMQTNEDENHGFRRRKSSSLSNYTRLRFNS